MSNVKYRILTPEERGEYKYELTKAFTYQLRLTFMAATVRGWVDITRTNQISIANKYRWDGPSGPTIDTVDWVRASLVHDALYQLMKTGVLSIDFRSAADAEMKAILAEDGMPAWRRWYSWLGVRIAGGRVIRSYRRDHGIDPDL